jgi:hypothetical protein
MVSSVCGVDGKVDTDVPLSARDPASVTAPKKEDRDHGQTALSSVRTKTGTTGTSEMQS